jgi:hypothetical protein
MNTVANETLNLFVSPWFKEKKVTIDKWSLSQKTIIRANIRSLVDTKS